MAINILGNAMVLMVLSGEEASHFFRNGDMSWLKN